MSNFAQDYRTLGVDPGCSLQSLKAARRRLVKSWHPDRFSDGAKEQAELRIKEINTAFDRLIEYHRNFGVLPGHEAMGVVDKPSPASARSKTPAARHDDFTPRQSPRVAGDSRSVFRWALITAGVVATIAATRFMLDDGPTGDQAGQPHESLLPHPGNPTSKEPVAPTPPATVRYFTIGSSLGEVYAAQGVPTATEDSAWHYGKSTVYFAKGVVTGWNHDPASPLHATSVPIVSKQEVANFFTFGSTKAEVRAVQGSPLLETDTVWDFGLSKVQFRDDRVIAWESSPMQPLRARR